ncbi:MAG: fused MFS/spermidine synthase [Gemmatimonadaceae bacterium]
MPDATPAPVAALGQPTTSAKRWAVLILFSAAIFVNATLLFSVQPMFTKMVLPLLGGTPAVWNTALLFFQSALLAGYLYAHVSSRWLPSHRQAVIHLVLLLAALTFLPLHIARAWQQPPASSVPISYLLGLLSVSLGVPFVLLAAGAPMLQRWFAGLEHPSASNPYMLYAASNLGSFAALLSYPLLVEPRLRLGEQSRLWLLVYVLLLCLIVACALVAWRYPARAPRGGQSRPADGVPSREIVPSRAWRLRWLLLSFAPSSLLVGVTTYLSTDIAAVPFLWVVPLALYLLTFVLVFANRPPLNRDFMLWLQLILSLMLIVLITMGGSRRISIQALTHLVAFFVTTMVCHRELADSRPGPEHLTEFYLWMSLGGVLGGAFNVLVAPLLYRTVVEYPFAIVIALGLRPMTGRTMGTRRSQLLDLLIPAAMFAVVFGAMKLPTPPDEWGTYGMNIFLGSAAVLAGLNFRRPLRLALTAGAIYAGVRAASANDPDTLFEARSFFGVYKVRQIYQYHLLQHGTTTHGGQNWLAEHRRDPLTYYHAEGPFGEIMSKLLPDVALRRVAVVGLGSGATSCFGRTDERWTYYEIDPLVPTIARNTRLFSYLRDCPPTIDIKLGDARLSLAQEPDSTFDLIILDAFSSDAIPVHLMTREALAMYLRKLRPGGAIAFHISNRYLELRPVLFSLAIDAKIPGVVGDMDVTKEQRYKMYYGSRWAVMAPKIQSLSPLVRLKGWNVFPPFSTSPVWTDDFSDVLSAMKW